MDTTERDEVLEGLNVFRAPESWGATLYAAWAEHETDPILRAGHLIIAEREANHARPLAERLHALGSQPGPACVEPGRAQQPAEPRDVRGLVAPLDAPKAAPARDRDRMAGCEAALARGFAAAKASHPDTHAFWARLYSEERVSGGWYRAKYGELSGKRPRTDDLPVLAPAQVVRRAQSSAPHDDPVACPAA